MGYIAWDKRTGEILYCLPLPTGNFAEPQWAKIFPPEMLEHIGTSNNGPELTRIQAQQKYWVKDGQVVQKPRPQLSITAPIEGQECILHLDFKYLLEADKIEAIEARVLGDNLEPADILLQRGDNPLVFDVLGELVIKVTDQRVQEATIRFEVMPNEGY